MPHSETGGILQEHPVLDREVLKGLITDVGKDTADMLLQSLTREIEGSKDKLEAYLVDENIPLFENQAHALKSAARSFGAIRLGECCLSLELAAKEKALPKMTELMPEFRIIVSATLKAFQ